MSYYVSNIELLTKEGKKKKIPLYFSTNSQDVVFQVKYFRMRGLHMVSPEHLRIFLGGQYLEDMDVSKLSDVSSWRRTITSFKKQLSNCMVIRSDLDLGIFKPSISHLTKSFRYIKEMYNLLEEFSKFKYSKFYYGLINEFGLIEDINREEAFSLYKKGADEDLDHACAAKMLLYHIEPTRLNQDLPDYNVKSGVEQMLKVILKNGIFEIYTPEEKKMDLLYFFYIQMDLSILLREYVIDLCKKTDVILDKLNTREELNSVNMNEEKLTFLTLYLICQPKLKSKNVDRAFTLLERFAQKPENKHLYIFIGDFLDSEFYGFSDADSFERRLICYSKSGHDGRIIACYMMLLQNLQDEHSRSRLENKILDMFGAKENFTLNDVYLMREISMKGGNFSLTDFLEIDFNKIFKEDYQFRASNDYTEIYSDLMLMVKGLTPEDEAGKEVKDLQKKKAWITSLLTKKRVNVIEFLKCQEILILLGRLEHLNTQFYIYKSLEDSRAKKCALRIKNEYDDYEPFQLVLYYFATDFNRSLKKTSNGLIDCLIMSINQLKREIYLAERRIGRLKEEYDAHEIYLETKGTNFSCFYKNCYLYYQIYKFLNHCNKINLADLFLQVAEQELFQNLENLNFEEMKSLPVLDLIIMNKILRSINIEQGLSDNIEAYLMLKIGHSNQDQIILFLTLMKLSSQDNVLKQLIKIANYVHKSIDYTEPSTEHERLITDYIFKVVEGEYDSSFVSYHPEFQEFVKKFWGKKSGGGSPKVGSEITINGTNVSSASSNKNVMEFYGPIFPLNFMGMSQDLLNRKICERFFLVRMQPIIKKRIIDITLNSKFELDLKEPKTLLRLKEDFERSTRSVTDFTAHAVNMLQGHEMDDSDDYESNNKKTVSFLRGFKIEDDKLTQNNLRYFIKKIKRYPNIRIILKGDILIPDEEDYQTPPQLALENVQVINGYIVSNQQKITKYIVTVKTRSHLNMILDNLNFMHIYSPLFINFIGLIYSCDFDLNIINLEFIAAASGITVKDYFERLSKAKRPVPFDYYMDIVYKILYAVNSLIMIGVPPPVLDPDLIFISKKENPQFLVPFFCKKYFCYSWYFKELLRNNITVNFNCFFVPPFYEELEYAYDMMIFLRCKNFAAEKFNDREELILTTPTLYELITFLEFSKL